MQDRLKTPFLIEKAEKAAWVLQNLNPLGPFETSLQKKVLEYAFLFYEGTLYFTCHKYIDRQPLSAIVILIQGIYEADPQMARKILRNPIFSTATPTEMCLGMVKVAAKRVHFGISP